MTRLNLQELAENEALKELGRVALIAVIPVLIDSLQKNQIDFKTILIVAIIAILRSVEKYYFKVGSGNAVTTFLKFE
jgi:hypothetical protein